MTSTYVIITLCCASNDGTLYNFSVTLNVKINCARKYENLLNFVKVMLKILAVPFLGRGVVINPRSEHVIYWVGQIKRGHAFLWLVTLDVLIRSKPLLANFNIISFLIRICHF